MAGYLDDLGDAVRKTIRAFHGSPYDFDKFDASKIGTGEGAQAYGHGLYFAGSERVADQYRRQLAGEPMPMDLAIEGRPVFRESWQTLPPLYKDGTNYLMSRLRNYADDHAQDALEEIGRDLPKLLEDALSNSGKENRFADERRLSELRGAMELLQKRSVSVLPSSRPGRSYEVEIGFPESSLLDWDAPISQQPKVVQKVFGDMAMDMPGDGRRVYQDIATRRGEEFDDDMTGALANIAASQELLAEGIPGIRYLDQGSRAAGQGTRNYVMFPGTEDSIRILRKYGLLAPVAAGAMQEQQ